MSDHSGAVLGHKKYGPYLLVRPLIAALKKGKNAESGQLDKTIFRKESRNKSTEVKKVSSLILDDGQAKPSLCGKMGWLGSIVFPSESLAAVHLGDDLADVKMFLREYACEFEIADLCKFIGGYQGGLRRRNPRLLKKLPAYRYVGRNDSSNLLHRV